MAQPEKHPSPSPRRARPDQCSADGHLLPFERSALLHPRAAEALILAASPYPGETGDRRPVRSRPGRLRRILRWFLA
jgi:hypothetical protein